MPERDDLELEHLLARRSAAAGEYRSLVADEEPPPALDRALLEHARAAVEEAGPRVARLRPAPGQNRLQRLRRFSAPLSLAAIVLLSATLVLVLSPTEQLLDHPAPPAARSPASQTPGFGSGSTRADDGAGGKNEAPGAADRSDGALRDESRELDRAAESFARPPPAAAPEIQKKPSRPRGFGSTAAEPEAATARPTQPGAPGERAPPDSAVESIEAPALDRLAPRKRALDGRARSGAAPAPLSRSNPASAEGQAGSRAQDLERKRDRGLDRKAPAPLDENVERRLDEIRRLVAAGDLAAAGQALARLRRDYPGLELPEDLSGIRSEQTPADGGAGGVPAGPSETRKAR